MSDNQQANAEQPMDDNLRSVNDSMLEGLGKLAEYFGYNQVMGQLYGALLLSPTPMSLDDLAQFLSISKANVSMNIRTLEHMGIVREVWVRGDRRKFYEAETDFWRIAINVLSSRELRDLEQALGVLQDSIVQLREAIPSMDESNLEVAELYVSRISNLEHFFSFAQLLITSILQRAAAGKFDVSEVTRITIE